MKNVLTGMSLMSAVIALSGCGTCNRGQMQGVYRGTKMDGMFLFLGASPASIVADAHMSPVAETGVRAGYVLGGLVDLPISLVIDTVCLPYDLRQDRRRIARWKASLRPLTQILTECVPPGAEVLDQPPADDGPWHLHSFPIVRPVGVGLDWTIKGRTGTLKTYRYPGEPGSCIKIFQIENASREQHLLVIRLPNYED